MKSLAEEMQAVSKGLEKVEQELTASENDGAISSGFQKVSEVHAQLDYFIEGLFGALNFLSFWSIHNCVMYDRVNLSYMFWDV